MNARFFRLAVILFWGAGVLGYAAPMAPDWVSGAAAVSVQVSTKDADAVVLLDEALVEFTREGERLMRTRHVVRILKADGKKHARAHASYLSDTGSVKSLKAWLVKPAGAVTAYAKKDVVDVATHSNALELYGQARQQLILPSEEIAVGAVFAFESLVLDKTSSPHVVWRFREELPVERSSLAVQLPEGWTAEARTFNTEAVAATPPGRMQEWTMSALPAIPREPMSPPAFLFAPWMAVTIVPPAKFKNQFYPVDSWESIARFFSARYDEPSKWDAAMKKKADQLVAGAATEWEKIRRLARYAQQVNYISIQLDVSNLGGYVPRPATRVFQCNYGDCKDKTTVLRALLSSQGIASFPLIVQIGSTSKIQDTWPSPAQFNHCILAVKVSDSVQAPAVIEDLRLGRLLLVDPTDEHTPAGLLQTSRLATKGILLAGEAGGLIDLPDASNENEKLVRRVRAEISAHGEIFGTLVEEYSGLASAAPRSAYMGSRADNLRKIIERRIGGNLTGARFEKIEPVDNFEEGKFTLTVEFGAPGYASMMRDKLLVFKPAIVSRREVNELAKKPRELPVRIRNSAFVENAEFILPAGFELDEAPAAVDLKSEFGHYTSKTTLVDGKLRFERELRLRLNEIPAADYEKPRKFFEKMLQSEQTPVVLRRVALQSTEVAPK